jgi:hypothetical protein
MPGRFAAPVLLLLLSRSAQPAAVPRLESLLNGDTVAALTLQAPLTQLFENGVRDDSYSVAGTVTYKDAGAAVTLRDVMVSVRGHTSADECRFPKLKLKLKGGGSLKIGTHCGESPDDTLSPKFGRLMNEESPFREGLAYKLLAVLGIPSLRTRPARITYIDADKAGGASAAPLVRNALLVEDDTDAQTRVNGRAEIPVDKFGNVRRRGAIDDASRIAFGEALVANFDWCLKFTPDDIYRCNDPHPLWNLLAFDEGNGKAALLMKDLDLSGVVVGRHSWFGTVFNRDFVPSRSETDIEVLSQVQRTRSLFSRARLDALRREFLARKSAAYAAVDHADVDARGRALARAHVDAFFRAIGDAGTFYRPVIARTDVQVYLDPQRTREACGPKDTARVGTPVNVLQQSGSMSRVVLLDVMWRWGPSSPCPAVRTAPVWIESDAITENYPR